MEHERTAPILHHLVTTYSSCTLQPIQRRFYALAAALGYFAMMATRKMLLRIYLRRVSRLYLVPPSLMRTAIGTRKCSVFWEAHITLILSEMEVPTTTHDKSIYTTIH